MGLLDWIRRPQQVRWPAPLGQAAEAILFEDTSCTELVSVVGESHYQGAIRSICGSDHWEDVRFDCTAALVPEPSNPHDLNAVMVQIGGSHVGYLSRTDAVRYQPMIREVADTGRFIACRARIAGHGPGGDTSNLGVFLQLPPADEPIDWSGGEGAPAAGARSGASRTRRDITGR